MTFSKEVLYCTAILSISAGGEGFRDIELLKSEIGMLAATSGREYLHSIIIEMEVVYLYHHVENHPLVDCNKRVGGNNNINKQGRRKCS